MDQDPPQNPRLVSLREASKTLFETPRYLERWVQQRRPLPGLRRVGWSYVVELDVLAAAVRSGIVGRTRARRR